MKFLIVIFFSTLCLYVHSRPPSINLQEKDWLDNCDLKKWKYSASTTEKIQVQQKPTTENVGPQPISNMVVNRKPKLNPGASIRELLKAVQIKLTMDAFHRGDTEDDEDFEKRGFDFAFDEESDYYY